MNIPLFYVGAGFDLSGGDMAKRFGNNFEIGGGFLYKTKTNWMFGLDMNFIYSDTIKEMPIQSLFTEEGYIIGDDGLYANIRISERGIKLPVFKAGRLFSMPFGRANINSGIFVLGGVGFMQHKIHYEDVSRTVSQLSDDYRKGYDRLTNGLALTQNVGYMYLDQKRRVNFSATLEFTQGFTKNRREYNFDLMGPVNESRLDLLYGIKLGWIFPAYKKLPQEYYYN